MNEYMYGVLIATDNTKIEIKNIITIHTQPITELTQVWIHEVDRMY